MACLGSGVKFPRSVPCPFKRLRVKGEREDSAGFFEVGSGFRQKAAFYLFRRLAALCRAAATEGSGVLLRGRQEVV